MPVQGSGVVLDQSSPTGSITQLNPVPLNTPATLNVNFSDLASGSSNIVKWRYQLDQGPWSPDLGLLGAPSANANGTASLPGSSITDVIKVCVQGQDAGGNWSPAVCGLLAVYDPSTGFVTGGGWIDSPVGAYVPAPSLSGKATFGFVSKYKKGQSTPDGSTEFQFHAGGMNFKSTVYEWLVVSGARAQFKGTGTINGAGSYGFLLTAIDGQVSGGGGADKFRIKIWDIATSAVVYDNNMSASDTADPTTLLGGGSINIQAK
jgi:hypothetical protein